MGTLGGVCKCRAFFEGGMGVWKALGDGGVEGFGGGRTAKQGSPSPKQTGQRSGELTANSG